MPVPNFDAMSESELYEWAGTHQHMPARRMAKKMFPDRTDRTGTSKAARSLVHYAWNAYTARTCRLRGDIQGALTYERIADDIYNRLPEWARW